MAVAIPHAGPQHNALVSELARPDLGCSWTTVYDAPYTDHTTSAAVKKVAHDAEWTPMYVLLGATAATNSSVFILAAIGSYAAVFAPTAGNTATTTLGADFYFSPGKSMGFAPMGSGISLLSADISSSDAAHRLSWHLDLPSGGYRVGTTIATGMNGASGYRKVVMYCSGPDAPTPPPLPLLPPPPGLPPPSSPPPVSPSPTWPPDPPPGAPARPPPSPCPVSPPSPTAPPPRPPPPAPPPPMSPLGDFLSVTAGTLQTYASGAGGESGEVAAAVGEAAATLVRLLAAQATVSVEVAHAVVQLLSELLSMQRATGEAPDVSTADSIERAVLELARAAVAAASAGQVVPLTSPNLNMTVETRLSSDLTSGGPVTCNATTGLPARAELPPTAQALLLGVPGFDSSQPVALVLFTSAVNFHGKLQAAALPEGVNASAVFSSPLVSFSLMQHGVELRVANASDAINISMPVGLQAKHAVSTCLGMPSNVTEAGCDYAAECRWWDHAVAAWSTAGCVTVADADGALTCMCDHLTSFIVFEFPTSPEQLLASVLGALKVNHLSARAWQCIATPYFHKIRVVWIINIALLALLILGVGNAIQRDRREIRNIERLVAGRKKEARLKILAAIRDAAQEQRKNQMKASAIAKAAKRKRCASMFAGSPGPDGEASAASDLARRFGRIAAASPTSRATPPPPRPARATTVEHAVRRSVVASIFGGGVGTRASPPPSPPPTGGGASPTALCATKNGESTSSKGRSWRLGMGVTQKGATKGRRQSRVQADVLGIFGNRRSRSISCEGGIDAADTTAPVPAAVRWRQASLVVQQEVLTKRWHKDVDRVRKRMWLEFKASHTLLSGLVYRGSSGFTRAQTVMILINSLALEIVTLCMFYSAPSDGPLVINPVSVVVGGVFAAAICIPAMLAFAWLYEPIIFVNVARWAARALVCWPCDFLLCVRGSVAACRRSLPRPRQRVHPQLTGNVAVAADGPACDERRGTAQAATAVAAEAPPSPREQLKTADTGYPPPAGPASPSRGRITLEPLATRSNPASARWSALALSPGTVPTAPTLATAGSAPTSGSFVSTRLRPIRAPSNTLPSPPPSPPPLATSRSNGALTTSTRSSKGSLGQLLRRGADSHSPSRRDATAAASRAFSYASLNEHLLSQSLTRSWTRRDHRTIARILFGWLSNLALFLGLMFIFSLYGCELFSTEAIGPTANWQELLATWGFSLFQRFIVNEPMLIVISKGAPILFTSAFCANVCGETIVNLLGLMVAAIATCIRNIKAGG